MKKIPGIISGTKTSRRPAWLKKRIDFDKSHATGLLMNTLDLNTVCTEARCPNISECFKDRHATFLILGKNCTRHCAFCCVLKGEPEPLDPGEPRRIAEAVRRMGLRHAVVTSVTRDDLCDGGSSLFAQTVLEIRRASPETSVELLIPDFNGNEKEIKRAADSRPAILGHNLETVERLYALRPEARYERSLSVLGKIKEINGNIRTKSALLLGLGEKKDEVLRAMKDLRKVGCDFLALGQYLRPSLKNIAVAEYVRPEKFEDYKRSALSLGFRHVESAPYVRSSYKASEYLRKSTSLTDLSSPEEKESPRPLRTKTAP